MDDEKEEEIVDENAWMQVDMEELLNQTPRDVTGGRQTEEDSEEEKADWCPYYPVTCEKANTFRCSKECDRHAENYVTDPAVIEEFEKTPYAIYCFTCGQFIESKRHEDQLDPPGLIGSHITCTGITEYRAKLREWVIDRLGVSKKE